MSQSPLIDRLSPSEQEAVTGLLVRLAKSRDAIEQALDLIDHLAETGNLAAVDGFFEDFDENFSALTRPDLMAMVANGMMLLGAVGQVDYAPFFAIGMDSPAAINKGYARFEQRRSPLGLFETFKILRSPEVAGSLEMLAGVLGSLRPGAPRSPRSSDGGEKSPPRRIARGASAWGTGILAGAGLVYTATRILR